MPVLAELTCLNNRAPLQQRKCAQVLAAAGNQDKVAGQQRRRMPGALHVLGFGYGPGADVSGRGARRYRCEVRQSNRQHEEQPECMPERNGWYTSAAAIVSLFLSLPPKTSTRPLKSSVEGWKLRGSCSDSPIVATRMIELRPVVGGVKDVAGGQYQAVGR
ncbi:MAG: hypothetical protein JWO42_2655 [Chloroflexi bacterium]|nr:hypothetical protein [Chloroflexota bacterium]